MLQLVLVCAGAETVHAQRSGLPLLQFGLGLGKDGGLYRVMLSDQKAGCYLGVSDRGMDRFSQAICNQLITEAEKVGAAGIFVDCERNNMAAQTFLEKLDSLCFAYKVPLFVPYCQKDCVNHAILVVDTALSGGSLEEYFTQLMQTYPQRIAADLRKISRDFLLPSPDTEGTLLKEEMRLALQKRTGAQVFFSRELCARYFTYMDREGNGHFVLFDDQDTLYEKYRCLNRLGISTIFARYSDVKELLVLH